MWTRHFNAEHVPLGVGEELFYSLSKCGFADAFAALSIKGQPQIGFAQHREHYSEEMRDVLTLLQFGGEVERSRLPGDLVEALDALASCGIVSSNGRSVRLRSLALNLIDGLVYFCDLPTGRQTLYYGTDSLALASRLQLPGWGSRLRMLDLCSGPGIQGLIASSAGAETISVEINPVAASLCECNIRLNGLSGTHTVVNEDLSSYLDREERNGEARFDLIAANPPLLPVPEGFSYPFVGDGGRLGISVTKMIVEGSFPLLERRGRLLCVGLSAGSATSSAIEEFTREVCKTNHATAHLSLLGVVSVDPDSSWIQGLCKSIAMFTGSARVTPDMLSDAYFASGVQAIYSYSVTFFKVGDGRANVTEYFDGSMAQLPWWV